MFNPTQSMAAGTQGDPQGLLARILGMGPQQPGQLPPTQNQPQAIVTPGSNGPLAKMFASAR